jgi:hypothetical protein
MTAELPGLLVFRWEANDSPARLVGRDEDGPGHGMAAYNHPEAVTEATLAKVERAAAEMGYLRGSRVVRCRAELPRADGLGVFLMPPFARPPSAPGPELAPLRARGSA